ncbi:MAG TPA: pyrroloquinoline quinone biosynthesis peptide chaperone PqqD [Planctomycetota bacterium]|nr:pyrroloquinoline quinone biosynthesis peptide chaperone PqqD [Planctomycetota bacterium]
MTAPTGRIALARRFRFQWEPAQKAHVLLFPEGMIALNDSAAAILTLCDGTRDAAALVADLEQQFPGAKLASEVASFLEIAHGRGWIIGT